MNESNKQAPPLSQPFGIDSTERLASAARAQGAHTGREPARTSDDGSFALAPGESTHMPLSARELKGVMSGIPAVRALEPAARPRVQPSSKDPDPAACGGTVEPGCGTEASLDLTVRQLAQALDQHPAGKMLVHQIRQICGTTKDNVTVLQSLVHYVNRPITLPTEAMGGGIVGGGDVNGPAVATDNAIARYDGTTGKLIQNSDVIIDDPGPGFGVQLHTPEGVLAQPLMVRPGTPFGDGTGLKLFLRGGACLSGDFGASGGDVDIDGGLNSGVGLSGKVNIGGLSAGVTIGREGQTNALHGLTTIPVGDLALPRLAAEGDTDTGLAVNGNDAVALVTNGSYRLAADDQGVVEHTGGWRGPVFRTSGNVTVTVGENFVVITGAHTVTLMAAPTQGFELLIYNAHSATNTVGRNGKNINGAASDFSLPAGKAVVLKWDNSANSWWTVAGYNGLTSGAPGDVVGPASATDNAIARFDGTTGKLVQESDLLVADVASSVLLVVPKTVAALQGTHLRLAAGDSSAGAGGGGNARVDAGIGAVANGALELGTANAESVGVGRSGKTTTINGNFALPNDDVQISEGGTGASTADAAVQNLTNGATSRTPVLTDEIPFYDVGTAGGKTTPQVLYNLINSLTAESSAPVSGDKVALYDASASQTDAMTWGTMIQHGKAIVLEYTGNGTSGRTVTLTGINRTYALFVYNATDSGIWPFMVFPNGGTGTQVSRATSNGNTDNAFSFGTESAGNSQVLTVNSTSANFNQNTKVYRLLVIGTPV